MKKSSMKPLNQAPLENLPSFTDAESRVFTKIGKDVYIGREKMTDVMRSLFRDEAKNMQTMRLWEVLNDSVIYEAYDLALRQSTDFDQVMFAKSLKHWSHFIMNVIRILSQED